MRKASRAGFAAMVAAAVVLLGGRPAEAFVDGPCEAAAEIAPVADAAGPNAPTRIDARSATGIIEIPDAGSVAWSGQIGDGLDTEPRRTSGSVAIVLPPVLDGLVGSLATAYSWGGDDVTAALSSGTETYDVPSLVPAGAQIVVTGMHIDSLGTCAGTVTLKLAGNPITEPVTIALLVLTAGTAVPLVLAGKP